MSDSIGVGPKKNEKRPSLGRGLGTLLGGVTADLEVETPSHIFKNEQPKAFKEGFIEKPTVPQAPKVADTERIWKMPIEKLVTNPKQPRQIFAKEALEELASSIKQKGILQPIVARKLDGDKFEIIAGERRWRAAQLAGLHDVPVILKESNEQTALELALIENIQREDLNPIEEAEAYQHLIHQYKMTQQELSEKVGKDRASIANTLRLLNLAPEVRQWVASGELSFGLAKVLLALTEPKLQKDTASKLINGKMTVRAAERYVADLLKPKAANSLDHMDLSGRLMKGLAEELQKIVGTKVAIDYSEGKGKISVHFYSDEEMNGLVEKIRTAWRKS